MCFIMKTYNFIKVKIEAKKINRVLEFIQWEWLKPYGEFNTQKMIEAGENSGKEGNAFYKLLNNVVHGKTMENLKIELM